MACSTLVIVSLFVDDPCCVGNFRGAEIISELTLNMAIGHNSNRPRKEIAPISEKGRE